MRKEIAIIGLAASIGVSSAAVAFSSIQGGGIGDALLFNYRHLSQENPRGIFTLDKSTFTDPDERKVSYANVVSSSEYAFLTKFVGFEKDEQGNIYLPRRSAGYISNVDGFSLGFNDLSVSFYTDPGEVEYLYGCYFSYNTLTVDDIFNGNAHSDLASDFGKDSTYNGNISYVASNGNVDLSQMEDSCYALFFIQSLDEDLYLGNVRFSTACEESASDPGEKATLDYSETEKAMLSEFSLGDFPFVGNLSYEVSYNDETTTIKGIHYTDEFVVSLMSYLAEKGFSYKKEEAGATYYQNQNQLTIIIYEDEGYAHPYYEISITDTIDDIESSPSWPYYLTQDTFSDDVASLLNDDIRVKFDLTQAIDVVSYTPSIKRDLKQNSMDMELRINNDYNVVTNHVYDAFNAIAGKRPSLEVIEGNNPDYVYDLILRETHGIFTIEFVSKLGEDNYFLYITENITYYDYPAQIIAESLGVNASLLGTYTSTDNRATYHFINEDTVAIENTNYPSNRDDALAYASSLVEDKDYRIIKSDHHQIILESDPFDGLVIIIAFTGSRVEISTRKIDYQTFDSLGEAISTVYSDIALASLHPFPAFYGDHRYLSYGNDIYISDCSVDDVSRFQENGIYDYLSDSYLFEYDEFHRLGIKARFDSKCNNIILSVYNVSKQETDDLRTAEQINLQYRLYEGFLDVSGEDSQYVAEGNTFYFLDESDYEGYVASLDDPSSGYSYYRYGNQYHNNAANLSLIGKETTLYGRTVKGFEIKETSQTPIDFSAYHAELLALLGNFAYSGSDSFYYDHEYFFITIEPNTYKFISSGRIPQFEDRLVEAGYRFVNKEDGMYFERLVDNRLYTVSFKTSYSDSTYSFDSSSGYAYYEFVRSETNYFTTYSNYASNVIEGGNLTEELASSVPSFSDIEGNFIHDENASDLNLSLTLNSSLVNDALIEERLIGKGFANVGDGKYMLVNNDHCIECSISHTLLMTRLVFEETVFDWQAGIDLSSNPFSFKNAFAPYVASINVEGNRFSLIEEGEDNLGYFLKTDDIFALRSALEGIGYSSYMANAEEGFFVYLDGNLNIKVEVELVYGNIYRVSYKLISHDGRSISTSALDDALLSNGFTSPSLFEEPIVLHYESGTSSTLLGITFFNLSGVTGLEEYLASSQEYEFDNGQYEKTDSNNTYTISIDGSDVSIIVYVSA